MIPTPRPAKKPTRLLEDALRSAPALPQAPAGRRRPFFAHRRIVGEGAHASPLSGPILPSACPTRPWRRQRPAQRQPRITPDLQKAVFVSPAHAGSGLELARKDRQAASPIQEPGERTPPAVATRRATPQYLIESHVGTVEQPIGAHARAPVGARARRDPPRRVVELPVDDVQLILCPRHAGAKSLRHRLRR